MIAEDELETALARAARRVRAGATRAHRGRGGRLTPARPRDPRSSPARNASPSSARPTTSCAAGWPTARPRSASPSPTSRPPGAGARAGHGSRRRAAPCCCRSGSGPPGSPRTASGVWRPCVSLAMAEAAEAVAALAAGNDPPEVAERPRRSRGRTGSRKLAGVLGETDGLGGPDPRAVIGLGVNTRLAGAARSRRTCATSMTSLREASGDRPIDDPALLARVRGPARGTDRGASRRPVRCSTTGRIARSPRAGPSGSSRPDGTVADGPSARCGRRRPARSSSSDAGRARRAAPGHRRRDPARPPRGCDGRQPGRGVTRWSVRH